MTPLRNFSTNNLLWGIPALLWMAGMVYVLPGHGLDTGELWTLSQWNGVESSPFFRWLSPLSDLPWIGVVVEILLVSVLLLLLNQVGEKYSLTRNLCIFPLSVFLLLQMGLVPLYLQPTAALSAILLLVGCVHLFDCYKQPSCRKQLFSAFFCFALAAVPVPPLLLLLPIMWLLFSAVNTLTIPRFLSSLAGVAVAAWLVWGVLFLTDGTGRLTDYFNGFADHFVVNAPALYPPHTERLPYLIFPVFYVLAFFSAVLSFWKWGTGHRREIKIFFMVFQGLWLALMILCCCYPEDSVRLVWISMAPFSVVFGKFLFERDNLFSRLLTGGLIASLLLALVFVLK